MDGNEIESNTPESAELTKELSSLVDATVETTTPQSEEVQTTATDVQTKTSDATATDDANAQSEAHAAEQPAPDYSAEQALFDRAIRAGLSSRDVLSIESREMVERMVEIAEKANGISPNNDGQGGVAGNPDVDPVDSVIEAMNKDGGYDANLMKLLNGLAAENRKLRSSRKSDERESFFDKQLGSLDEGITRRVDAMHKSQLKAKFDLLKAGYAAQGSHIRDEDVFQEAARLALGDLIANAREERKASALEQRRNLTLARPGGESGRRGGATADDDPFADFVAAMG